MERRTEDLTVRGVTYVAHEWSNKTRRLFIERAKSDPASCNALLASRSVTLNSAPAFASEEEADEAVPEVLDALAAAVLRVSKAEGDDSKNA